MRASASQVFKAQEHDVSAKLLLKVVTCDSLFAKLSGPAAG